MKERIQQAIKEAMKQRKVERLECLRMAKGALLVKEKSSSNDLTEEDAIATMRAEVRKRRQSFDIFREHGKEKEAEAALREIAIFEEFLPQQLAPEEIEQRVRAFLEEHPEVNHPGKLTGVMKKELGDSADGKILNAVCRKVLS